MPNAVKVHKYIYIIDNYTVFNVDRTCAVRIGRVPVFTDDIIDGERRRVGDASDNYPVILEFVKIYLIAKRIRPDGYCHIVGEIGYVQLVVGRSVFSDD